MRDHHGGAIADVGQRELWQRIAAHDFEPDTPLNFTRRLARDKGWTLDGTRRAIDAYRRFCFLAVVTSSEVTPSEIVDEVWHQHLIYTRDYWDVWCAKVLRARLHHNPTPGGPDAQQRYRAQYAETLALHETYFGPPDPSLWPGTAERFAAGSRYRTIDTTTTLAVSRPSALLRRFFNKG